MAQHKNRTGWTTARLVVWLAGWLADWLVVWLAGWLADQLRLTKVITENLSAEHGRLVNCIPDCLAAWPTDWLTHWLTCWLALWSIFWLTGVLTDKPPNITPPLPWFSVQIEHKKLQKRELCSATTWTLPLESTHRELSFEWWHL